MMLFTLGCEKDNIDKDTDFKQYLPEIIESNMFIGNLRIPAETKVIQYDSSCIEFILPNNIYFVYENNNSKICFTKKESYTCTCSASGGCTVFYKEDIGFGCQHSNCGGSCTGTTGSNAGSETKAYALIDFDQNISFVEDEKEIEMLFELNELILKIPEINEELKKFITLNEIPSEPNKNNPEYCAINVYGCLAYLPAPSYGNKNYNNLMILEKPEFSCSCGSGTLGCEKDSHWSGIVYCRNTVCASCTMTVE